MLLSVCSQPAPGLFACCRRSTLSLPPRLFVPKVDLSYTDAILHALARLVSIISSWLMASFRNITAAQWERAREVLVFYFARRHSMEQAEDLAQETLTAVWGRQDYEFSKEEDFLRVCLGFARRVSLAGHRLSKEGRSVTLEQEPASPFNDSDGSRATEQRILLAEVKTLAEAHLTKKEWDIVQQAAGLHSTSGDKESEASKMHASDPNRFRVYLHRARKKLALITGWQGDKE